MNECTWTFDMNDESCIWNTGCGQAFGFGDGGPKENEFRYCCYCGGSLKEERIDRAKGATDADE